MDTLKIGNFVKERRKAKNLTQSELARRLNITDRAVSKWECGRSLPDSAIMPELCKALGVSINELLSGEEAQMDKSEKRIEQNLLQAVKEKEQSDRRLLKIEMVLGIIGTTFFLSMVMIGLLGYGLMNLPVVAMVLFIVIGVIAFIVSIGFCLLVEQKAGYYECKECHHRYVPTFTQVLFAPHINRSRYMKCPCCGKKSYHKKVVS